MRVIQKKDGSFLLRLRRGDLLAFEDETGALILRPDIDPRIAVEPCEGAALRIWTFEGGRV